MIGRRGERGSGISVLVARHDDDDNDIFFEKKTIILHFIKGLHFHILIQCRMITLFWNS